MTPTDQPPARLNGDDLYAWARLVADVEHAQQQIDRYGKAVLQRHGLDPRKITITNEGYLIPMRDMASLVGTGGPRRHSVGLGDHDSPAVEAGADDAI